MDDECQRAWTSQPKKLQSKGGVTWTHQVFELQFPRHDWVYKWKESTKGTSVLNEGDQRQIEMYVP